MRDKPGSPCSLGRLWKPRRQWHETPKGADLHVWDQLFCATVAPRARVVRRSIVEYHRSDGRAALARILVPSPYTADEPIDTGASKGRSLSCPHEPGSQVASPCPGPAWCSGSGAQTTRAPRDIALGVRVSRGLRPPSTRTMRLEIFGLSRTAQQHGR
jgi:hypothetical protein